MCVMCTIRITLKEAMDEVDALPEVGSALYDDAVAKAYSELETAYYLHQHYCNEMAEDIPVRKIGGMNDLRTS